MWPLLASNCHPSATTSISGARFVGLHHYHVRSKESSSDEEDGLCGCGELVDEVGS